MDIYERNGVVPVAGDQHKVTKIKAFARPWNDSILLDPKGEYGVGTNAKAVNQHLINGVEEFNGSPREEITLYDNGEATVVKENGMISCATTTIYPVNYVEQPYSSDNHLDFDGSIHGTLNVPITPEDGSFTYGGDIGFNFDVEKDIDLSSAYNIGDNVVLEAYKDGNGNSTPMIRLKDTSIRDSASNYIDTVFTVPHGNRYGEAEVRSLTVKNARLNSALTSFLDAKNYYDEILIPHEVFVGTSPVKTGRHDGLRTLREGEYFFTSKYPFKILPISDVDMDTNMSGMNYANIYGTVRFKVVVKGEECIGGVSDIPSISQNYRDSMVNMFLNSSQALTNPSDNRTFPHRTLDIDLYVMTRQNNGWSWQMVASNRPQSSPNIVLLDSNALSSAITLKIGVPMFFSKSYVSSFFTGSSTAPTFDAVKIKIGDSEDIWASTSEDIGEFHLQSEKSYRFLFDYTANTTEIAFFDGNHGSGELLSVNSTELSDYAKMVRINSDDVKESDYLYNDLARGWMSSSAQMLKGKCGFKVDYTVADDQIVYRWSQESNAFGNPYMKSYGNNKLYHFDSDYSVVDNNYLIPYMYENGYHQLSCVPQMTTYFNELAVLDNHHKAKMRSVNSAIATLKSSTVGLVSAMSRLEPQFTDVDILPTVITHEDYDYISQVAVRRSIPTVTDGITVTSTELFGNNMIASQYFNDPKWSIDGTSVMWVDDSTYQESKNVWEFPISSNGAQFTYGENTYRNIVSNWEIAVCLSGSGITGVSITFISADGKEVTESLTREKQLTSSWYVWSKSFSDKSCTSIRYTIKGSGTAKATKFVARRRRTVSHPYGLGDCLKSTGATNMLILPRHTRLMMMNRVDNWVTPLLVRSNIETVSGSDIPVNGVTRQYLLSDGCVLSGNRLLKPWVGHITYSDKARVSGNNGGKIYGYYVKKTTSGGLSTTALRDTEYYSSAIMGHQNGTSTITLSVDVNFHGITREWSPVPTNFKVHEVQGREDLIPPVSLTNETFGGLSNTMNAERLNNGLSSHVVITNVQLIEENDGDNVLYEFEYLPIIYDEKDQHLSFNYVVVLDKGEQQ